MTINTKNLIINKLLLQRKMGFFRGNLG